MWAAVAAVLVGFAEESADRGVSVVAFRSSQDLGPTVVQLVFTFLMGSVLYAVRRATGTLIVPMVLHGAWDFVAFTSVSDAFENPDELVDPRALQPSMLILLLMLVLFAIGFKQAFRSDDTATSLSVSATSSR